MLIYVVAGARPNFVKIAPLLKALRLKKKNHKNLRFKLIHTGQHYDYNMSGTFFKELKIQKPNYFLNSNSGSHSKQTASVMLAFEKVLLNKKPSLVIVVGDVNSTMSCTIVAKKLNIPVAHIEAGIRSYDMTMPEEINRIITDSISDYFFTTTKEASQNLINLNLPKKNVFFVGNTMIDSLYENLNKLIKPSFFLEKKLNKKCFFLLTIHRPSNVDDLLKLKKILKAIDKSSNNLPIVFPVHPRLKKKINKLNFSFKNIIFKNPLSYFEFLYLLKNSKGIITDSGGVTEEATVLNIPCITLRENTERPETIKEGTNELVGDNLDLLIKKIKVILDDKWKNGKIPKLWDGKTSIRIVDIITKMKL